MLTRVLTTAMFTITMLSIVGCELYYLPPHIQTPAHKEKGDVALNLQGLYTGSASASYAFSDHGFAGISFMGYSATNADTFNNDFFRVGTLEGGYYDYDDESNIHLQVSGGIGAGTVGDPSNAFEVAFQRFYIQPSIGFISSNRKFENHLSMRVSHIGYEEQVFRSIDAFSVRFVEPAYTFRAGAENFKFQMQLGLSLAFYQNSYVPVEFVYDPFIFSIGVQANLNVFQKKQ